MDDRFRARRGTYRVIYRIDDKAHVVTVVDATRVIPSLFAYRLMRHDLRCIHHGRIGDWAGLGLSLAR
jgi:hypothetical protein